MRGVRPIIVAALMLAGSVLLAATVYPIVAAIRPDLRLNHRLGVSVLVAAGATTLAAMIWAHARRRQ